MTLNYIAHTEALNSLWSDYTALVQDLLLNYSPDLSLSEQTFW